MQRNGRRGVEIDRKREGKRKRWKKRKTEMKE